jgi:hypothetical protein
MCATNSDICGKVVSQTNFVDSIVKVIETGNSDESELSDCMMFGINCIMTHCELQQQTLNCFLELAFTCLIGNYSNREIALNALEIASRTFYLNPKLITKVLERNRLLCIMANLGA